MPEDLSKVFEPTLDPLLAVERLLAAQAGPPDAASHAVIPTSSGGVDKVGTRDRQGWISWNDAYRLTTLMTRVHWVALGTGEHKQRCLSSLCVPSLCGPWATIWFPASHQAQPYRKLYDRSPAVRCRDGLYPGENVAAASCRSRSGERGSDAIAVRSSTEPALLGLRRGQGSTWGTRLSVAGGSQRGRVCTQPHPAGWAWGGRRENRGQSG